MGGVNSTTGHRGGLSRRHNMVKAAMSYLALFHHATATKHQHAAVVFDETTLNDMATVVTDFAQDASSIRHAMAVLNRISAEIDGNLTVTDAHALGTRSVDDTDPDGTTIQIDLVKLWEDKFKTDDPEESFEKFKSALPLGFWRRTPTTEQAAGNIEFIAEFLADYRNNDTFGCKADRLSAMSCFAYHMWGDTEFKCGITNTDACRKPTASEVMVHVNNHWNNYSIRAKVDLTRKVLFTAQSFQSHVWDLANLHLVMGFAQGEIVDHIDSIVKRFTPTIDGKQVAKCELVKQIIKITIELMLEAVSIGSTFMAGPMLGKAGRKVPGKVLMGIHNWLEKKGDNDKLHTYGLAEKYLASHVKTGASLFKLVAGHGQKGKSFGEKVQGMVGSGDGTSSEWFGEYPGLGLHISKAKGLCGSGFSVPVDDTKENTANTKKFVQDYLIASEAAIEKEFNSLISFNEGADPHLLGSLMQTESVEIKDDAPSFSELKRKFKSTMEAMIISKVSAASRCFLACEEGVENAHKLCQADESSGSDLMSLSRFCPKDRTDVRCQLECVSNQKSSHMLKPLYGLEKGSFEAYGINMTERKVSEASWANYQVGGTEGAMSTKAMTVNTTILDADDVVALPVCLSKTRTIENIFKGPKRTKFPWGCGALNSESGHFLRAVNVHPEAEKEFVRENLKEASIPHDAFGSMLTESSQYLKYVEEPLNSYLLLCAVNVKFPFKVSRPYFDAKSGAKKVDWTGNLVVGQRDSRCDAVAKAVSIHNNEKQMNHEFCSIDLVGRIIRDETKLLVGGRATKGTHWKCKSWMESNGYTFNKKNLKSTDWLDKEPEAEEDEEDFDLLQDE